MSRRWGGVVSRCGRLRTRFSACTGEAVAVAEDTAFFYDGWQVCEETDGRRGATRTSYVWSPVQIDELVQLERAAGHPLGAGTFYAHQNARADVIAVTDGGGSLVESFRYVDFGNADVPSTTGNPYGFQGRRLDDETGLYYFRNRYYDPSTGRFLQRDPVWDSLNQGNQYTFAGSSPPTLRDPYGTWTSRSAGIGKEWQEDLNDPTGSKRNTRLTLSDEDGVLTKEQNSVFVKIVFPSKNSGAQPERPLGGTVSSTTVTLATHASDVWPCRTQRRWARITAAHRIIGESISEARNLWRKSCTVTDTSGNTATCTSTDAQSAAQSAAIMRFEQDSFLRRRQQDRNFR